MSLRKSLFTKILYSAWLCGIASSLSASMDGKLDELKNSLIFETQNQQFYIEGGAQIDWVGYYTDNANQNPPGFFFPQAGKSYDWSPRLTLTLDAWLGENLYGFIKWRWDDGVHPGLNRFYGTNTYDFRFDEVFVRYELAGSALQLQVGRFVPILGNFLNRQSNWDAGLISYPMLYEQVTPVSDQIVEADADDFASRKDNSDFPNKITWLPAYWAQLYTQGAVIFGIKDQWDYSLNVTNASPASRGVAWNDFDWSDPTYLASLGYKPNTAWRIGLTGTHGAYFQEGFESSLPNGDDIGDYMQTNLGLDLSWKKGLWSVWAEVVHTDFEVPNVDDTVSFWSYYIEARYAFKPRWWLSARWNEQIYNKINTSSGAEKWDNDQYRIDFGLGHRPTRHTQIRLQYSYQQQDADFQNAENFVAAEFSIKL